jgi:Skp family chaperone for outer membrane proteins
MRRFRTRVAPEPFDARDAEIAELKQTIAEDSREIDGLRRAMEMQSAAFVESVTKTAGDLAEAKRRLKASSARMQTQREENAGLREQLANQTENKALRVVVDVARHRIEELQDTIRSKKLVAPCDWCCTYYELTDFNFKALLCGCAPCVKCIQAQVDKTPNSTVVKCIRHDRSCSYHLSFRFFEK